MQAYTSTMQAADKKTAQETCHDELQRNQMYENKDYEFLLALDDPGPVLSEIYKKSGESVILKILNEGYVHIVQSLLDKVSIKALENIKLIGNGEAALCHAIRKQDTLLVNALIAHGVSIKDTFSKYLNGNIDIDVLEYFIDNYIKHIDINSTDSSGKTLLMIAAKLGSTKILSTLLTNKVNLDVTDTNGFTALHYACLENKNEIALLLLTHGANPNIKNNDENFPLLSAIKSCNVELLKMLLEYKADPNINHHKMILALNSACVNKQYSIVELLLAHRANPNPTLSDEDYPLILSCIIRETKMVEILLKYGADPNLASGKNNLALIEACRCNDIEIVKLLLEHGANPDLANDAGMTPRNIAIMNNFRNINKLFAQTQKRQSKIEKFISFFKSHNASDRVDNTRIKIERYADARKQ